MFILRNVIAHGKEINYYERNGKLLTLYPDKWIDSVNNGINAGYKTVEEFLRKNNIISSSFKDENDLNYLFSIDVVNYFWSKTRCLIESIDAFVKESMRDLVLSGEDTMFAMFPKDGTYYLTIDDKKCKVVRKGDDISFIHDN